MINKNTHYINSGPLLSKALLLKERHENKGNILIVSNTKKLNDYSKIFYELKYFFIPLDNFAHLVDAVYNKAGNYIVEQTIFESKLYDFSHLEQEWMLIFSTGIHQKRDEVVKKLGDFGYKFSEHATFGSYHVKGDSLHIYSLCGNHHYSISYWGDTIEEIFINGEKTNIVYIGKIHSININEKSSFNQDLKLLFLEKDVCLIIDEIDFYRYRDEIYQNLNNYISFISFGEKDFSNLEKNEIYIENIEELKKILENSGKKQISIYTKNITAISNFIKYNNIENVEIIKTGLNNLKSYSDSTSITLCDDNLSRIFIKKRAKRNISKDLDLLLQIKPGDYIVHVDHGVAIFTAIVEKELKNNKGEIIKKEYIELEYKNNDKLFVPITEVSRVSKYVGSENPKLTGLSTKEWERKLEKVSQEVEEIAGELLDIYAKRKLQKGYAFPKLEKQEAQFAQSFDYVYTEDQYSIIQDIFADMESENPMDRLICGDVGFGKTEIAFNAIFKAISSGKQAALISPLVVLAYEHFDKARTRFTNFPFNIEVITRFESPKNVKITLEKLKEGKIDFIIGTHRLLSEDIQFKDLGLLVIDEEHKFGVKDKEKIKSFKGNIDILSLSATPIPRSLNLALNGIKSISMLTTPPKGRQAIETIVSKFDEEVIAATGKREFERGGQLFFIHNRVETIENLKISLQKIFPNKKIIIAHGQLPGDQLEERILAFKRKQFDILLSTTVIENGIDFPNVNTIFINNAYNFGISQIHQLRGRVGRSDKKGYCYLLYNKDTIKEDAAKRLKTIVDYSHLGAGFELAIKDLEIRGGGDILGVKQSGQSKEIGVNLFLEMLENKVAELKAKIDRDEQDEKFPLQNRVNTTIDLNISAFIPDEYFGSELDKINFYREIESLSEIEDLQNIIEDFTQIAKDSGRENLPKETQNFFDILTVKLKASGFKIKSIKRVGINYQIDFIEDTNMEELKAFLDRDTKVRFVVSSLQRLRTPVKNYYSDREFLDYMLDIVSETIKKKKIKLKKRI